MEKIIKKFIFIIGILFVGLLLVSNILFDARLSNDLSEHVSIKVIQLLSFIVVALLVMGLYYLFDKILIFEKINRKIKIIICIIVLAMYFIIQVVWINYRQAYPGWDSQAVYNIAYDIYEGNSESIKNSEYVERNPQQLPLAFMESLIFRLKGKTGVKVFQYINALANVLIIVALALIAKELMDKSKYISMCMGIAFIPLALLSTFIYGDIVGLACALWSVYFLIKSNKNNKWYFVLISALILAFGIIFRKNILIFIIAEVMYMFLNIISKKTNIKKLFLDIGLIIAFIVISILPSKIITLAIQKKYDVNVKNEIPVTTYLYIGMTDGYRGSGWYNDNANWAWEKTMDEAKEMYNSAIKDRIKELITNPKEFIKFYAKKNISMYAENTYASLYYNESCNFGDEEYNNPDKDEFVISQQDRLQLYQKALVIVMFLFTILALVKSRNNLSNEKLLLLIIFIGGFLFHNMWEAKSRYIIPYLIVLIPLASGLIASKNENKNEEENN